MKELIKVKNLSLEFGRNKIFENISFDITENDSIAIMGASGSGKTALVKNIIGLLKPSNGTIEISGKNILDLSVEENCKSNNIAMVFQNGALLDSINVWENIAFKLTEIYRKNKKSAKKSALKALEMVNLEPSLCNKNIEELSGGMRKRVAIARALITKPKIIILDEPTTGLDPITTNIVNKTIKDNFKNATRITVTHNISCALSIANKIMMIYKGNLLWYGECNQVFKSQIPYIQEFINASTIEIEAAKLF